MVFMVTLFLPISSYLIVPVVTPLGFNPCVNFKFCGSGASQNISTGKKLT